MLGTKGVEHRHLGDEGAAIACFGRAIKIDYDRPSPVKKESFWETLHKYLK